MCGLQLVLDVGGWGGDRITSGVLRCNRCDAELRWRVNGRFDCSTGLVEEVDVDIMVDLLSVYSSDGAAEGGVDFAVECCRLAQEFSNETVLMNEEGRGVGDWKDRCSHESFAPFIVRGRR